MMRLRTTSLSLLPAALAALLPGCASAPAPVEELTWARTLVAHAEKSQAQRYAPNDLVRAQNELRSAQVANSEHRFESARTDAESAAVDAAVAMARASESQAHRAAEEARERNQQQQEQRGNGEPSVSYSDLQQYPEASQGMAAPHAY